MSTPDENTLFFRDLDELQFWDAVVIAMAQGDGAHERLDQSTHTKADALLAARRARMRGQPEADLPRRDRNAKLVPNAASYGEAGSRAVWQDETDPDDVPTPVIFLHPPDEDSDEAYVFLVGPKRCDTAPTDELRPPRSGEWAALAPAWARGAFEVDEAVDG